MAPARDPRLQFCLTEEYTKEQDALRELCAKSASARMNSYRMNHFDDRALYLGIRVRGFEGLAASITLVPGLNPETSGQTPQECDVLQSWTGGASTLPYGPNVAAVCRGLVPANGLKPLRTCRKRLDVRRKGLYSLLLAAAVAHVKHTSELDTLTAVVATSQDWVFGSFSRVGFKVLGGLSRDQEVVVSQSIPGQQVQCAQFELDVSSVEHPDIEYAAAAERVSRNKFSVPDLNGMMEQLEDSLASRGEVRTRERGLVPA